MQSNEYIFDGFRYQNEEDLKRAKKEAKNIEIIRQKLDYNDKEMVQKMYDKLVKRRLLSTPEGYAFLHELYVVLVQNHQVAMKDLPSCYVPDMTPKEPNDNMSVELMRKENKTVLGKLKFLRIVILILALTIGTMFYITLTNDNTGYINTENKILNKYSSWEEELTKREQVIKDKEEELGIDHAKE